MSQYNKTVLTRAGLELAKRANAGQAKFGITRAVASADDWSHKTVQDLEEVTTIPNIMQQGTIVDTDEVESNNSVIGVSLCFTNKNLSTGYQIRIIGLYVKEEGQENDFLYAVTTAISPEYMPSFADKVLYRFNMQMYLVIGNAQSVNVVINDGTAVTHGQLDKYKAEVTGNLKKLENTHKEDMSHVAKSASINGGAEILPDSTGKLNLVVPDPDLSEYVSLEQLTETLQAKADVADVNKQIKAVTDLANTKANSADVYTKTETDNQINKFDLSKVKFHKQYINSDGQAADKTWSATKNEDGTYTIDLYNDDWTASKLVGVLTQLPNKADTSTVNAQINALDKKAVKSVGIYPNNLHFENGSFNYWSDEVKASPDANGYALIDLTDDTPVRAAEDQLNAMLTGLNHLQGKQTKDSADANALSETGVYYCSSPAKNFPVSQWGTLVTSNGNGERASQLYFPDDNTAVWFRTFYGDWQGWVRLANIDDVNNAKSSLTSSINTVNNKVNVGGSLFRMLPAGNTWNDILGFDNGGAPALVAFRGNSGGPMNNLLGNYSAGVAFGGGDTKGFLEVSYGDHNARIGGGNGSAPVWHEDIAWKSDIDRLQNKLAQYTVDYNNNYVHDTTIDFNSYLHETRTIKVANVKANNGPLANTATIWGWLTTYHWDDNSVTQEYRDAGGEVFWRATNASASRQWTWHKYAKQEDIDNQQRQINDLINNINYIKDNYVEGRRFPASQEAQAEAWENEKPTRLAMIEK